MLRNSKARAVLCKYDRSRSQCYDASLTFDISSMNFQQLISELQRALSIEQHYSSLKIC